MARLITNIRARIGFAIFVVALIIMPEELRRP